MSQLEIEDMPNRSKVLKLRQRLVNATIDFVPSGPNSPLQALACELCTSVCDAAARRGDRQIFDEDSVSGFVEHHVQRIKALLTAIPPAFHHVSVPTENGEVALFELDMLDMLAAAPTATQMKPEKVVKAIGTIWSHTLALSALKRESAPDSWQDLLLNVRKEGVEYVAELYLEADDFVSPQLEWAIVDALVFQRVTEFASACAFAGNLPNPPDGQLLNGPLLPGTGASQMGAKLPTWSAALGNSIARASTRIATELAILALTWGISDWVTGGDGSAKWTLFTGLNAVRWVRSAIYARGSSGAGAKGVTNLQMLWDMGIAHERVPAMHVGLLRHLLYRLEERGAAFSPAVYTILDKRAKREASSDTKP